MNIKISTHFPGSAFLVFFLHLGILMLTFAWEILSKSSKKGKLWAVDNFNKILLLFSYILVNEF